MTEIVLAVEHAPEGGYTACAPGEPIFSETDGEAHLRVAAQDAVFCHFDEGTHPKSSGCALAAMNCRQHQPGPNFSIDHRPKEYTHGLA